MANPVVVTDALFTPAPPSGSPVLSASKARTGLAALVAHDGAGTRLGVFYEGNQSLVAGTATTSPSMQVSVSPLAWCGQKAATEGVYVGRSTATVLVDVAAAPASNSRIDVVYVMERDASATTSPDGVTQGEIGVIAGTAAASPTKPGIPAGAVEVGTITVNAGVTATTNAGCTVATTCQWTAAAGSRIPVRNQAQRDAMTPYTGLEVCRLDLVGSPTEVYDSGTSRWWGNSVQALSYGANFGPPPTGYSSLVLAVSGKVAMLSGHASWVTGTGGGLVLATIPAPFLPAYDVPFSCLSQNNSNGASGSMYRGVVAASSGVVSLSPLATTTQVPANVIPILATWLVA